MLVRGSRRRRWLLPSSFLNTVPVVAEMSRGAGGAPEAATIGESPEDLLASDGMVVKQNFKDIWKVCLCQPNYQVSITVVGS